MIPKPTIQCISILSTLFLGILADENWEQYEHEKMLCRRNECRNLCLHAEGAMCLDRCYRTKSNGCVSLCHSKNCEVDCGKATNCTLICPKRRCERIKSSGGKECHHICYGECAKVNCQCKKCYFYKIDKGTFPMSPLTKNFFYCRPGVLHCNLLCSNATCVLQSFGKYIHGDIINNANAFFEIAEVVTSVKLNCQGNSSCLLLHRQQHLNLYRICRGRCGQIELYQAYYFHTQRSVVLIKMMDDIILGKLNNPQLSLRAVANTAFGKAKKFIEKEKKGNDWYVHDKFSDKYPAIENTKEVLVPSQRSQPKEYNVTRKSRRNSAGMSNVDTVVLFVLSVLLMHYFHGAQSMSVNDYLP